MKYLSLKISVIVFTIAIISFFFFESSGHTGKILKIDFKNPVVEHNDNNFGIDIKSMSFNSSVALSLLSYVNAINAAANDPAIKAIYMTPDNLSAGISQIEEIRNALLAFRNSGKPIISYSENFSNTTCYLSSVANVVVLNPTAENYVTGLSSMQFFLKDLIDDLGINIQLIRHGKYKSAGEMFTKDDISPENREQIEKLLNTIWNSWSEDIANSRGFSTTDFNSWIDNLELINPTSLVERGLVDDLLYKDQLEDSICKKFSAENISFIRYVDISQYADKLKKGSKKSKIAVIYADGEIVTDGLDTEIVGADFAKELRKIRKDDKIKAVVVRVNSPGGSVQASEMIKRELDLLKGVKPVIASFGDYAASGGYWISSGVDKIFTDVSTITGSIGCFSMIPSFGDAINDNLHVKLVSVGTNRHADMMQGIRKLSDSEVNYFQKQIEMVYDDFISLVSEGRGLSERFVDSIGQGRVWSGSDAVKLNLADEIGGLNDAIKYAANQVNVSDYRLVEYPAIKTTFERLFGSDIDLDENLLSASNTKYPLLHVNQYIPIAISAKRMKKPTNMVRLTDFIVIE